MEKNTVKLLLCRPLTVGCACYHPQTKLAEGNVFTHVPSGGISVLGPMFLPGVGSPSKRSPSRWSGVSVQEEWQICPKRKGSLSRSVSIQGGFCSGGRGPLSRGVSVQGREVSLLPGTN